MSEKIICVENVNVTLHTAGLHHKALENINFCLKRGEHLVIYGANGAGKSTFLRLLAGLTCLDKSLDKSADSTARITWYYQGLAEQSPIMARRMTALVSPAKQEQCVRYQGQLRAEELLLTALAPLKIPHEEKLLKVQGIAKKLHCLELLSMQIEALSQGQLRLLLIGYALLQEPEVLLLDECLDGLDEQTRIHVIEILQVLAVNTTIVICTHRGHDFIPFVKRQLFMHEGRLVANEVAPARVDAKQASAFIDNFAQDISSKAPKPIISVENATIFVDRIPVLTGLNWQLCAGEHWMIHGANGAGKSTFLRLLAGDEYPAAGGSIRRYFARLCPEIDNVKNLELIRRGIRLVSDYEQTCYGYDLTGLNLVLSGIDNVIGTYREFNAEEEHGAAEILAYFGLMPLANRRISTLSTGQLRRLFIARALMAKPEVLLLDEPFSGLDAPARHKCIDSLDDIAHKLSIILVSHNPLDCLSAINAHAYLHQGTFIKK